MENADLYVLKAMLGGLAVITGIIAGAFGFWSSVQTKREKSATQQWFRAKWMVIIASPWLQLPERVIDWLLRCKVTFTRAILSSEDTLTEIAALSMLVTVLVGTYLRSVWVTPFANAFLCTLIAGMITLSLDYLAHGSLSTVHDNRRWVAFIYAPILLAGCGMFVVCGALAIDIALTLPLGLASILMVLTSPLMAVIIVGLAVLFLHPIYLLRRILSYIRSPSEKWEDEDFRVLDQVVILGVATGLSFSLTLLCFQIGNAISPSAFVPRTLQMLAANAVFDGLTVMTAIAILERAVGPQRKIPIPVAVLASLVIATSFACASLWCGLAFTPYRLSLAEVARVLIGQSVDGTRWELGPYFWAMHTVFLPAIFYSTLLLACWSEKSSSCRLAGSLVRLST